MKITCAYCGNLFNDTLEQCPYCGAPNVAVVRKSGNQPITIEELKQWYADRGLPPYEETRFFIGEDYRQPRAFGIYKDEKTQNFVVYKNKDNGQRAVRYEGTDEAYAVNELYQRLKQEIIQQKQKQIGKRTDPQNIGKTTKRGKIKKRPRGIIIAAILLSFFWIATSDSSMDIPKTGYYSYESKVYYALEPNHSSPYAVNNMFWFVYTDDWVELLSDAEVPDELEGRKSSKRYFLLKKWSEKYSVPDFLDSAAYTDAVNNYQLNTGYYDYSGTVYYHLTNYSTYGWYYFDKNDKDWYEVEDDAIPEPLVHSGLAEDFYFTPTWDATTQITDFEETETYQIYQEYQEEQQKWDNDNDDDDYDWGDDYDWDSNDTDWDSDW